MPVAASRPKISAGTHPHDPDAGMPAFEAVELRLDLDLVTRIEQGLDSVDGPALVDQVVLRPRGIRAHRRGVDHRLDPGARGRLEDPTAAVHIDRFQGVLVARRLDCPGEMDDRVGPVKGRFERTAGDVRAVPVDATPRCVRYPARDTDDRIDLFVGGERPQDRAADIPRCSRDHDAHVEDLPREGR